MVLLCAVENTGKTVAIPYFKTVSQQGLEPVSFRITESLTPEPKKTKKTGYLM
jgi:hypothetical protein